MLFASLAVVLIEVLLELAVISASDELMAGQRQTDELVVVLKSALGRALPQ